MTVALQPPERRTAILFDPYPLVLDAVEEVVTKAGVDVVGKATSSEQALALADSEEPDVLIAEIALPDGTMDGLECMREARRRQSRLKTIVFSLATEPDRIEAAFEAGADAYVVKTAHPDDLASAVRQAFDHSVYLAGEGSKPSHEAKLAPPPTAPVDLQGLTRRELEILKLVAEGHANAEVARMLWVTEQTVKFHLSNVYRKLRVANRTEAGRWAQLHGLLPDEDSGAETEPGGNGTLGAT